MSKETMAREAVTCPGCGGVYAHIEYHAPHCSKVRLAGDVPLTGIAAVMADSLAKMGEMMGHGKELAKKAADATVRNSGVAELLHHGPVRDEKQRKGAKVKRTSAKGRKRG